MGSISRHLLLLASVADTQAYKHTCTHKDIRPEVFLKNQAWAGLRSERAWFNEFVNTIKMNHHRILQFVYILLGVATPQPL